MKKIIPILLMVAAFWSGCAKEEIINARVSGVYSVYIKGQSDFWIEELAVNYNEDTEMNGFASWDGENAPQTIRILIDKISKNRMNFTIPEQSYEGESNISGSGIHVNGNIEFYYIIGNSNISRSYVMNGNR